MVIGMATTKITITLMDDQVHAIRELISAKRASSVSGFVQHAVWLALSDAAGWQTMLDDALLQTGGPLTQAERDWADEILEPKPAPRQELNQAPRPETKSGAGRSNARRNKAA